MASWARTAKFGENLKNFTSLLYSIKSSKTYNPNKYKIGEKFNYKYWKILITHIIFSSRVSIGRLKEQKKKMTNRSSGVLRAGDWVLWPSPCLWFGRLHLSAKASNIKNPCKIPSIHWNRRWSILIEIKVSPETHFIDSWSINRVLVLWICSIPNPQSSAIFKILFGMHDWRFTEPTQSIFFNLELLQVWILNLP